MKAIAFLLICLAVKCHNLQAQSIASVSYTFIASKIYTCNSISFSAESFSEKKIMQDDPYAPFYYALNKKIQTSNVPAPKQDQSIINFTGYREKLANSSKYAINDHHKSSYNSHGFVLLRLCRLAEKMHVAVDSLKANCRVGLKLCCQKTICGASVKAYKKATGLTFFFPVGK